MDIDLSKFARRKVNMTPAPDLRSEDEKVFQNVKGLLAEKFPKYEGGLCYDMIHLPSWATKTFHEKTISLFNDTCYHMH